VSDSFNVTLEGKQLVKFFIACATDTRICKKIDAVMSAIDIPICLVKTPNSFLAKHMTDISLCGQFPTTISDFVYALSFNSKPIEWAPKALLDKQKLKPRIKSITLESRLNVVIQCNPYFLKDFGSSIENISILPSAYDDILPRKYCWKTILNYFPNTKRIYAGNSHIVYDCSTGAPQIFPHVQEIWGASDGNDYLPKVFPNLVILTLSVRCHQKDGVDLSELLFLQELVLDYYEGADSMKSSKKTLELTVFGGDLRKLRVNNDHIKIQSKKHLLDKLEYFGVECDATFSGNSDAMDLHNITPNLKHLAIEFATSNTLWKLANFTQITHLELISTTVNRADFPLICIIRATNLTKLTLVDIEFHGSIAINMRPTLGQIRCLTWINVTEHNGLSSEKILPPFNIMPKLKYLKMQLIKLEDLTDIIAFLCEIESLHIINPIKLKTIDAGNLAYDLGGICNANWTFCRPAVNTEEFLARFHVKRLTLVQKRLNGYDFALCKKLIFESSDPMLKTCLDQHNDNVKTLHSHIHHNSEISVIGYAPCDSSCDFYNVNFALQFIHRHIETNYY
jgi:hypothetical protein